MMGFTLKNNIPQFLTQLQKNNNTALENIGKFCKSKMQEYVAVDTGKLKFHCAYKVSNKQVVLLNDVEYAGYQEFGTYKMKAHPFMRPAVYNHIGEITSITARSLQNGIT